MSGDQMLTCATCGNVRPEGTPFCGNCGTPFVQPDQQLASAVPPPANSWTTKQRLRWAAVGAAVALLVAGGTVAAVSITGGDDKQAAPTEFATVPVTDTTEPDLFDDTTDTTDSTDTTGVSGQGVDQTCEDLVAFFTLVKEVDIVRGGHSVDDVERVAAVAAELASNAPAEPEGSFFAGDPRDSLERIAEDYRTYVSVLSELGLEPGPDALLEPRISAASEDVSIQVSVGIGPWIETRCSEDVVAQLEQLSD